MILNQVSNNRYMPVRHDIMRTYAYTKDSESPNALKQIIIVI